MNVVSLARQFEAIGARLVTETVSTDAARRGLNAAQNQAFREGFAIDVIQARRSRDGAYALYVRADRADQLDMAAVDVRPRERHLLLMTRPLDADGGPIKAEQRKFLCGHDERHWFVASVARVEVARVEEAMESLKPGGVAALQKRLGVRSRDRNRRVNAAFIRQGEWFFVPAEGFRPPEPAFVLHNEPIRRGAGKPHLIEELYREGGEQVWVCTKYPNGVGVWQYEHLLRTNPKASRWDWQMMRRNPRAYARGKVRHADHATITLPFWHQILMSTEVVGRNVAFLD
jgi:hypothetical protein